jgi:hypothetical protein
MSRESVIKRRILSALNRQPFSRFFSVQQGRYSEAGISDIIGCCCGSFVAFEVKTPTGTATAKQRLFLTQIQLCGGYSAVVRSVEDAMEIIDEIRQRLPRVKVPGPRMVGHTDHRQEDALP